MVFTRVHSLKQIHNAETDDNWIKTKSLAKQRPYFEATKYITLRIWLLDIYFVNQEHENDVLKL